MQMIFGEEQRAIRKYMLDSDSTLTVMGYGAFLNLFESAVSLTQGLPVRRVVVPPGWAGERAAVHPEVVIRDLHVWVAELRRVREHVEVHRFLDGWNAGALERAPAADCQAIRGEGRADADEAKRPRCLRCGDERILGAGEV